MSRVNSSLSVNSPTFRPKNPDILFIPISGQSTPQTSPLASQSPGFLMTRDLITVREIDEKSMRYSMINLRHELPPLRGSTVSSAMMLDELTIFINIQGDDVPTAIIHYEHCSDEPIVEAKYIDNIDFINGAVVVVGTHVYITVNGGYGTTRHYGTELIADAVARCLAPENIFMDSIK